MIDTKRNFDFEISPSIRSVYRIPFIRTNRPRFPKEKRKTEREREEEKFSTITFARRNGDCIEFPYRLLAAFPRTVPPSLFSPWTSCATCRYSFTLFPSRTRGTTILPFLSSCGTLSASGSGMGERFEKVRTIGIVSSFTPWKDRDLLDALGTKDRAIFFAPGSRPPDNYTRIDTIFATTAGIIKTFFIFFPLSLLPRFLFVLLLNSFSEFRAEYFSLNASTARQGSPPMIATWLANGRGLWRWTTRWKLIKTLESSRRCISLRIFSINNRKTVDRRPSDDVYTVEQFFRFFFINSYLFFFDIFLLHMHIFFEKWNFWFERLECLCIYEKFKCTKSSTNICIMYKYI